jgi:hypothetical protein
MYTRIDRTKLAKNGREHLELLRSDADWIVRAPEDLMQLRSAGEGALAKLPEENFRAFVDGLEFKAGGVCGGNYKPLTYLEPAQMYEVFEHCGVNREYVEASLGRACVKNRCKSAADGFCFASICSIHVKGEKEPE